MTCLGFNHVRWRPLDCKAERPGEFKTAYPCETEMWLGHWLLRVCSSQGKFATPKKLCCWWISVLQQFHQENRFLNPHGDFFGDVGVAWAKPQGPGWMWPTLLSSNRWGFGGGKKTCGRIASSLSLDDLCFRLFRHFDSIFFLKKICLVHVHSRSSGGWLSLGMWAVGCLSRRDLHIYCSLKEMLDVGGDWRGETIDPG